MVTVLMEGRDRMPSVLHHGLLEGSELIDVPLALPNSWSRMAERYGRGPSESERL
jgi:hypothetical protein